PGQWVARLEPGASCTSGRGGDMSRLRRFLGWVREENAPPLPPSSEPHRRHRQIHERQLYQSCFPRLLDKPGEKQRRQSWLSLADLSGQLLNPKLRGVWLAPLACYSVLLQGSEPTFSLASN